MSGGVKITLDDSRHTAHRPSRAMVMDAINVSPGFDFGRIKWARASGLP